MSLKEAFELVLELARQNVCNQEEHPEEFARQMEAIAMVTVVSPGK